MDGNDSGSGSGSGSGTRGITVGGLVPQVVKLTS